MLYPIELWVQDGKTKKALTLSYFLSYFCVMRRKNTQKHRWYPVFDGRKQKIRGLWVRNGVYAAQVRVHDWTGRVPLQGSATIPQAFEAMQELKAKIRSGKFIPRRRPKKVGQSGECSTSAPEQGSPASPIKDAVAGYKHWRDTMKVKDEKTCKTENAAFTSVLEFMADKPLSDIKSRLFTNYTSWRRERAEEAEKNLSNRTINQDIATLRQAVDWAVGDGWLEKLAEWPWQRLPDKPKDVRLLETTEVEFLRSCRLLDDASMALIAKQNTANHRTEIQQLTGQAFSDYLGLLQLTGGRATETVMKRWSHVLWDKRLLFFPGDLAKAGGGKPATDRYIPFYDKLEAHLKDMQSRRDESTDYMFPSPHGGHIESYRTQWEQAKDKLLEWHIKRGLSEERAHELVDDVGLHYFRHYFISQCVMAGMDFRVIAEMVSHRDGGLLIGKKYSHLAPGHLQEQAAKLNARSF